MDIETRVMTNRRELLAVAAGLPLLAGSWSAVAAGPVGDELPLRTNGLEHFGMMVPDVTVGAKFYTAVFGPGLFREKDLPLRYYVTIGKAYIALGSREGVTPKLDHFNVVVDNFDRDRMMAKLTAAGLPNAGRGMTADPDGIGLQMLKDPAGLAATTVPADPLLPPGYQGYGVVQATGMDHVLVRASDLDRSAKFYDRFFARTKAGEAGQIWFKAGDTTVRVARQAPGKAPALERWGVRVGAFDPAQAGAALTALGATVQPGASKTRLRFNDPWGLGVELVRA